MQPARSGSSRLHSLDGLRGIAAVEVMFFHLVSLAPAVNVVVTHTNPTVTAPLIWVMAFTPVRALWDGRQAVLLFFVLSGLVLTLPFLQRSVGVREFWVRRVLRIYPLYWLAVSLALVLMVLTNAFAPKPVPHAAWLGLMWNVPVSPSLLINAALLIFGYQTLALNGVIWSLVHEMRISLIFPWLVAPFAVWRPRASAAAFAGLVVVCYALNHELSKFSAADIFGSTTFLYIPLFALGAVLARHRDLIAGRLRALGASWQAAIAIGGIVLIGWPGYLTSHPSLHRDGWTTEAVIAVGIALLIAVALTDGPIKTFLSTRPVQFLGRASYGVYLLHVPVIAGLARFFPEAPLWLVGLVAFVVVIPLSGFTYQLLEQPCIRLGHRLAARLMPESAPVELAPAAPLAPAAAGPL